MPIGRRWYYVTSLLITTSFTALMAGCGDDAPTKEILQAQQAIDSARDAGAAQYATEEFTAAEAALTRAQASVTGNDYRQALNDALDARDRAQTAAKDAAERKAALKTDVDRALHDAALAVVDARAKLRAAETGRRSPRVTAPVRRSLTEAETHVQEARTAFDKGDYLEASTLLKKTMLIVNEQKLRLSAR
jgi:flagellar hook-basal body complex protein FliE